MNNTGYELINEKIVEISGKGETSSAMEKYELSAFSLRNFKAFQETPWIRLNHLALVCGENSSGKSVLYQVLWMLKTAWEKLKREEKFYALSSLEGMVGNFSDICSKQAENNIVEFHFEMKSVKSDATRLIYKVFLGASENDDYGKVTGVEIAGGGVCWDNVLDYYECRNLFFLERRTDNVIPPDLEMLAGSVMYSLRHFAERFQMISAHRFVPKRMMQLTGTAQEDLGENGSQTYNLLHTLSMMRDDRLGAINDWLNKFGYSYYWEARGKNFGSFMLRNNKTGVASNLVDNGFGISQSLPIAVAVMMSAGQILLIDSPEAFLQTGMQSEMGDLLLKGAKEGRVFTETGSEYILLRIRRRIAEGKFASENLSVYFIEDEEDKRTVCYELNVDENGEFDFLPPGFRDFFSSDFHDMERIDTLRMEKYRERTDE
ncbi:MAG: hypothetical protein LUF88_13610 [Bacteroides fragilis]|nr:hypothetical protein [Bacteroides fragilis]